MGKSTRTGQLPSTSARKKHCNGLWAFSRSVKNAQTWGFWLYYRRLCISYLDVKVLKGTRLKGTLQPENLSRAFGVILTENKSRSKRVQWGEQEYILNEKRIY